MRHRLHVDVESAVPRHLLLHCHTSGRTDGGAVGADQRDLQPRWIAGLGEQLLLRQPGRRAPPVSQCSNDIVTGNNIVAPLAGPGRSSTSSTNASRSIAKASSWCTRASLNGLVSMRKHGVDEAARFDHSGRSRRAPGSNSLVVGLLHIRHHVGRIGQQVLRLGESDRGNSGTTRPHQIGLIGDEVFRIAHNSSQQPLGVESHPA